MMKIESTQNFSPFGRSENNLKLAKNSRNSSQAVKIFLISTKLMIAGSYGLAHQSRSCPSNTYRLNRVLPRRTSVAGTQDLQHHHSEDHQQYYRHQGSRGSSPQIRTFGPDGRHQHSHELLHAASSFPPSVRGSRWEIFDFFSAKVLLWTKITNFCLIYENPGYSDRKEIYKPMWDHFSRFLKICNFLQVTNTDTQITNVL